MARNAQPHKSIDDHDVLRPDAAHRVVLVAAHQGGRRRPGLVTSRGLEVVESIHPSPHRHPARFYGRPPGGHRLAHDECASVRLAHLCANVPQRLRVCFGELLCSTSALNGKYRIHGNRRERPVTRFDADGICGFEFVWSACCCSGRPRATSDFTRASRRANAATGRANKADDTDHSIDALSAFRTGLRMRGVEWLGQKDLDPLAACRPQFLPCVSRDHRLGFVDNLRDDPRPSFVVWQQAGVEDSISSGTAGSS